MRKLLIVFLVSIIALAGMASAYTDVGDIIKGKDKFGALWLPDYGTAPSQGWISLGTDKNFYMYYDETTNDRVDLTMTAGGMYFDVTDVTFYTDDPTNESLTFTGFVPSFADGLTAAKEATFSASVVYTPYVNNTSNFTVGDNDYYTFHVGNATADQTVTLPTAADNAGRFLLFVITEDPGDNNFVLDGEGAETVGGAATKTCTGAVGSLYYIYCDGLAWRLVSSQGTWS